MTTSIEQFQSQVKGMTAQIQVLKQMINENLDAIGVHRTNLHLCYQTQNEQAREINRLQAVIDSLTKTPEVPEVKEEEIVDAA